MSDDEKDLLPLSILGRKEECRGLSHYVRACGAGLLGPPTSGGPDTEL